MALPTVTTHVHLFFDSDELVGEGLLDIGGLHGEHRLKGVLLAAQHLHLLLVVVEFIGDVPDLLLSGCILT